MESQKNSILDYSKISVTDMCQFLNDSNENFKNKDYFLGLNPHIFTQTEMYEYIKYKTDNFDTTKFEYFIEDLRSYLPVFDMFVESEDSEIYTVENVHIGFGDIGFEYVDGMMDVWGLRKRHEFVDKIQSIKEGVYLRCMRLREFSEIAEDLYQKHWVNEPTPEPTKKPKTYQLQTKLTDTQRGKLFDLLVLHGFIPDKAKESFIWAFGGEQNQPNDWQPIEWIDKSITRKEPNIQTLYELLYLLGVDKDTSANNPNNLYRKMQFCFSGLKNIAAKNPCSIQQNTDRQKLLKTILEEVEKVEAQK